MANDNLQFKKNHMTFVDGYFYMFDDDTDMLLQKTDDGITAFSYPFDTLQSKSVLSCEHDGINFWSMYVGDTTNTLVINRWRIENYICKLKDSLVLSNPSHNFVSDAFTVEHYHCTISGSYIPGDTLITVNPPPDKELVDILQSGMSVTIGPNSSGKFETIDVQHVSSTNIVTIADPLTESYADEDEFLFYNNIWLFNDYNGNDDSTGALYKINAYSGSVIGQYPSGVYQNIKAATFYEIDHFTAYGKVNSLMYVKASNLLFINISDPNLSYYGSMAMDTISSDEITILPVYDIAIWGKNVYRLQDKATYFGATSIWTTSYNYQAATFNPMVTSLAMTSYPNVIAANGISVADITARIKDQFLQPISGRIVYFYISGTAGTGQIVSGYEYVNSDANGEATSFFRAGTESEVIPLLARVQQV